MFLWQKYKYHKIYLSNDSDFISLGNAFNSIKPEIVAFDTEADGLHLKTAIPFLIGFGFENRIYIYEPTEWRNNYILDLVRKPFVKYFMAHNAKFDYHMFRNFGTPITKDINIADTLALARLTDYVDSNDLIGLEALGTRLIDSDAKFAGSVIKEHLKEIDKKRYGLIKEYVKENQSDIGLSYTQFKGEYTKNRVQYCDHHLEKHFKEVDKLAPRANYRDSYNEKPELMKNYLTDDVLLVLEVYKKLSPILDIVDKDRATWHRENKLAQVVGDMESNGMRVDIKYMLDSRARVKEYIVKTYEKLWELADIPNIIEDSNPRFILLYKNPKFTVGQHEVIKALFLKKFKLGMLSTDLDALEEIVNTDGYPEPAKDIARVIISLRTLDKWLSTYIEGMLNRLVGDRLYTNINNSGTVTGRVSSDMQQQPKEALLDEDGNELFHPRKVFIADEGYTNYYIDFSNMELRVQAQYTLKTSSGDLRMCRAFMPFNCFNYLSGDKYDLVKDKNDWNSGEWVYEDGTTWQPLDLHSETTKQAFPEISVDDKSFKEHYRQLGKRANFLKNYGGGKKALISKLKIDEETAEKLDRGYYSAFPKILDYQKWVDDTIRQYGYVENLLGRKYYFSDTRQTYKGYNYLIQGSCADYVKEKEIEIDKYLEGKESKMIMPIHDEIVFSVANGEEYILKDLKTILEQADSLMKEVPMVAEVSVTHTNWAEKEEIKL